MRSHPLCQKISAPVNLSCGERPNDAPPRLLRTLQPAGQLLWERAQRSANPVSRALVATLERPKPPPKPEPTRGSSRHRALNPLTLSLSEGLNRRLE